jgi:hypothetical protein
MSGGKGTNGACSRLKRGPMPESGVDTEGKKTVKRPSSNRTQRSQSGGALRSLRKRGAYQKKPPFSGGFGVFKV